MKQNSRNRIGMTLFFSLTIFVTSVIAALIVGVISYLIINFTPVETFSNNPYMLILSVLFASIVVGTSLSPIMGHFALRPVRTVIAALDRLSGGDFSTRLHITHPPEFQDLADSFNTMAEELGSVELLRTDFINNFSHEFKTPIVSIKGFAEILKSNDLTIKERNEYLDIVISESTRLATLATNVLNLSKIENQSILTDQRIFDLSEQIRRCILMFESKWEQKKISLSVYLQDVSCTGNEELLNQVWINLLDNALKFTPECGKIMISLKKTTEEAIFMLRDNGAGIGEASVANIFTKFYQEDHSHSTVGNGLGLTLAKKIVDLHEGHITCTSKIGEGTEFIVSLPLNAK